MKDILEIQTADCQVVASITGEVLPATVRGVWRLKSPSGEPIEVLVSELVGGKPSSRVIMLEGGMEAVSAYRVLRSESGQELAVDLPSASGSPALRIRVREAALTLRFFGGFTVSDRFSEGMSATLTRDSTSWKDLEMFESVVSAGPRCLKAEVTDADFADAVFNALDSGERLTVEMPGDAHNTNQ